MKLKHIFLLFLLGGIFPGSNASAQLVGGNAFLQGQFLETSIAPNGSWGNTAPVPAGYHAHSGATTFTGPGGGPAPSSGLDFSYDVGHDGWTAGSPTSATNCCYYGAYFLPGTPFIGWSMQVDGIMSDAYYTDFPTGYNNTLGGTLTGAVTGYQYFPASCTGIPSHVVGTWTGSAGVGGVLKITQRNILDTTADWLVVTTKFVNTGSTTLPGIYYLATGDPDNDQPIPGTFTTDNHIVYQGVGNRHEVVARPDHTTSPTHQDAFSGLAAIDCRAKVLIYQAWPPSAVAGNNLDLVWSETPTSMGSTFYGEKQAQTGDIAIGVVFKLGDLAPGDSTTLSYAWVFSDTAAIDSAFPQPVLVTEGVKHGSSALVRKCAMSGCGVSGNTFTADILNGDDRDWSQSKWSWTPSTGLSSVSGTHVVVDFSAISSITTYTITGIKDTAHGNCGTPVTFTLTVDPCFTASSNSPGTVPPGSPPGTPPETICMSDTLRLYAHGDSLGATYLWTGPGGYTATDQNPIRTGLTPADMGIYHVTRSLGGSDDTTSTTVILKALPVINATNNGPICSGTTLILTSSPDSVGETWSWSGPLGFASALSDPTISGVITARSGTYKVIAMLHGCIDSTTTVVVIDSTPEVPTVGSNTPVCKGDTLMLTGSDGTAGVTYNWAGPNSFASTLANPMLYSSPNEAMGIYTLTVTLGVCTNKNITEVVIIDPTVVASVNSPVCTGLRDTIFLTASSAPGATYSWTGPYSFSSSAQNPTRTPVVAEHGGIYHVTAFVEGCPSYADIEVVTHQTPPPPWVKWITYCQYYDAPPLQAFGTDIQWFSSSAGGASSTVPPVPQTSVLGWTFYYANQTVGGCQSAIDSIKVQVNPNPTVTVKDSSRAICPRDTVKLVAMSPDPIAYFKWMPYMYIADTVSPETIIHPETDLTYSVVVTNQYGCTDTAKVDIRVRPAAVIYLEDSVTLYPGETFKMDPQSNCTSFRWTPSGGLSTNYVKDPVASPEVSTRYFIYGVTEWGCKAKDSIDINIRTEAELDLPNAFAPGNGPNGKFKVLRRGIASLHHFRIYDRWGVMVFEAKNIDDGWDGTYNGTPQPLGVYIYEIEAVSSSSGRVFHKKGNVTLLR